MYRKNDVSIARQNIKLISTSKFLEVRNNGGSILPSDFNTVFWIANTIYQQEIKETQTGLRKHNNFDECDSQQGHPLFV